MNILRSYKRTRFFLWVNITGLAIGLAVSIMLILFVVNELSYDKHFANKELIAKLQSCDCKSGGFTKIRIKERDSIIER